MSAVRVVKTQGELEAALADESTELVEVRSDRGVWLTVWASGSATVRAYDSATVRAYDSATVEAYDSATVRASKFVAVHLHCADATVSGGHIPATSRTVRTSAPCCAGIALSLVCMWQD